MILTPKIIISKVETKRKKKKEPKKIQKQHKLKQKNINLFHPSAPSSTRHIPKHTHTHLIKHIYFHFLKITYFCCYEQSVYLICKQDYKLYRIHSISGCVSICIRCTFINKKIPYPFKVCNTPIYILVHTRNLCLFSTTSNRHLAIPHIYRKAREQRQSQ